MSDYLHFFSEEEADRIVSAIEQAERATSGEIRVHIEDRCKHNPTARAVQVFERLGMCETREKNGVLFYVSSKDHDFAVIGDSDNAGETDAGDIDAGIEFHVGTTDRLSSQS